MLDVFIRNCNEFKTRVIAIRGWANRWASNGLGGILIFSSIHFDRTPLFLNGTVTILH
jgi:hypothetical protein